MKKILGLDLGITSIGRAYVMEPTEEKEQSIIKEVGTRLVPLNENQEIDFSKGESGSSAQERTLKRAMRRRLQRYKLRRQSLIDTLDKAKILSKDKIRAESRTYELLKLRALAASKQVSLEGFGRILLSINKRRGYKSNRKTEKTQDNKHSNYLQSIDERREMLLDKKQTIGQYIYQKLEANRHERIRGKVFYRQDYIDEFERIWDCQSKYYPEILTKKLRMQIQQKIIFFQRRLKSKKSELAFCQFESKEKQVGHRKVTEGARVIPKSSPVFQHFRIWQQLSNTRLTPLTSMPSNDMWGTARNNGYLTTQEKEKLSGYLNLLEKLDNEKILQLLGCDPQYWQINHEEIIGNKTNSRLMHCFLDMMIASGHQIAGKKDKLHKLLFPTNRKQQALTPEEVTTLVRTFFEAKKIEKTLLDFDPLAEDLRGQSAYRLWHLLYSAEEDNSVHGTASLIRSLHKHYGFAEDFGAMLVQLVFEDQYGSLSNKAIRKILPHLNEYAYAEAAAQAGYRHSQWETQEETQERELLPKLDLLHKGSLRNPVVEKILNQMIHVLNAHIAHHGHPDEIRIEMAREIQSSAQKRKRIHKSIRENQANNDKAGEQIRANCGIPDPSKADIIKYKLWKELEPNGYKTLYSDTYIPIQELFTGRFDVEHIIPRSIFYDDSFSNKTLELQEVNRKKGNMTAIDFVREAYGEKRTNEYIALVENLYQQQKISATKYKNLLIKREEVGEGFTNRDLVNTQYITREAAKILSQVCRSIVYTNGTITSILRKEWGLLDIMRELSLPKYRNINADDKKSEKQFTTTLHRKDGKTLEVIKDWSKRNDHRHHALDALVTAFTTRTHVQYFNTDTGSDDCNGVEKLERIQKLRSQIVDKEGHFKPPMQNLRQEARKALDGTLISIKAKNKVTTPSKNKSKNSSKKPQITSSPRGLLHEETRYGRIKHYQKNPHGITLVERSVVRKRVETIKKEKDLEKVIDPRVREILQKRIKEKGTYTAAFSDLENDPIWFNKDKGIAIKSVRMYADKAKNAQPIHSITDQEGKIIPIDFVMNKSNHHAAVYKLPNGSLQAEVVSFREAVVRSQEKIPIIDKTKNASEGWVFLFSIKKNEYFLFPSTTESQGANNEKVQKVTEFNPSALSHDFIKDPANYPTLAPHLFRVQGICDNDYTFRHQYESKVDNKDSLLKGIIFQRVPSSGLQGIIKVHINHLGFIDHVGEY